MKKKLMVAGLCTLFMCMGQRTELQARNADAFVYTDQESDKDRSDLEIRIKKTVEKIDMRLEKMGKDVKAEWKEEKADLEAERKELNEDLQELRAKSKDEWQEFKSDVNRRIDNIEDRMKKDK